MYRWLCIAFLSACIGCGGAVNADSQQPVSHWLEVLKSPDRHQRKLAIHMLRDHGAADPATVPALVSVLKDKNPDVRYEAITALAKIGPNAKPAVAELAKLQKDTDPKIRTAAADAVRAITGKTA